MTSPGQNRDDFRQLKGSIEGTVEKDPKKEAMTKLKLDMLGNMVGLKLEIKKPKSLTRTKMLNQHWEAFLNDKEANLEDVIDQRRQFAINSLSNSVKDDVLVSVDASLLESVLKDHKVESFAQIIQSNDVDKLAIATSLHNVNGRSIKENLKILVDAQKNIFELEKLAAFNKLAESHPARLSIQESLAAGSLDQDFAAIYEEHYEEIGDSEEDLELYKELLVQSRDADAMEDSEEEEQEVQEEQGGQEDKGEFKEAREELRKFIPQGIDFAVTNVSSEGTEFVILDEDDENAALPAVYNEETALINFKPEGFEPRSFPMDKPIAEVIEEYKNDYQLPEMLGPLQLSPGLREKFVKTVLGEEVVEAMSFRAEHREKIDNIFRVISEDEENLQKNLATLGILVSSDELGMNVEGINADRLLVIVNFIRQQSITPEAGFELLVNKFAPDQLDENGLQ